MGTLDSQRGVYYATLVVLALVALAVGALRRASPGRRMIAVRDNRDGASAFGFSPTAIKLGTFALSGFIACAAGVLWLGAYRNLSVDLIGPQNSFLMLALPVIGGLASVPGAILGSALIFGVPLLLANVVASIFPAGAIQIQLLLGGAGLIVAVAAYPAGIAGALKRLWEKVLARAAAEVTKKAEAGQGADTDVLSLRDVSVHFGGITAVDNVSIRVGREEIVGLIGANGAGKTTLVNVISGFLSGEGGTILVGGEDVTMLGPDYRAHIGIARGFQDARLFPALTVRETVQLALSREAKAGIVASLVGAPWVRFEERDTGRRADELIQALGLEPWAEVQTANLSTGTRRVCDLAAQMAAQPKLLLLDEPTAGVAQHESEALGQLLRRVAVGLGCSVLIIEHNMPVMLGGLVDRLYCLESGRIIAEGSPDEIRSNPAVIASYFGTAGAATGRRVASNGNKSEDVDGTKRAKRNPRIRATQSIRPARIKEKR